MNSFTNFLEYDIIILIGRTMAQTNLSYPSITEVGKYLSYEDFCKQRLDAASWVHNNGLVDMVLSTDFKDIFPLHFEVEVTSRCNFNCGWCSCASARSKLPGVDMTLSRMKKIIDECQLMRAGIQWTGGEPLMNASIYDAIDYATSKNVPQCLFTNGSLLDEAACYRLLVSNLKFIRISINSATISSHSLHHGNISTKLSASTLLNCNTICKRKTELKSKVSVGFSLVLDDEVIDDYARTLDFILGLAEEYPNSVDYIVIRPVNNELGGISYSLSEKFFSKFTQQNYDAIKEHFGEAHIKVVFPNEMRLPLPSGFECLGCTMFSEIAPNGNLYLCSDKYGEEGYRIGNVDDESICALYRSFTSKPAIGDLSRCYADGNCPKHSRGQYFNCIFNQIKAMLMAGKRDVVQQWIRDLKNMIPAVDHSFFI